MSAAAVAFERTRRRAPRDLRYTEVATPALLEPFAREQALNATRHAAALRPFKRQEFGAGPEAPSEGHIQVVNNLVGSLRQGLLNLTKRVSEAASTAVADRSTPTLQRLVRRKEQAHTWVQGIEKIWDFYFELFGQRQGQYGMWLLSCDRIALDCYQTAYLGVGAPKSIPAPPPFCYMRTGFSPATYRRGIPLRKLGKQLNPFPLIQLPYHRLVNPWTLGAILHEVSHNLQSDLGLNMAVPKRIARTVLRAGGSPKLASTWTRWNRETFADMSGLLLGGPAIVGSLFDTIGRSPESVSHFIPGKPHPTPFLRSLISCELLRRMGFEDESRQFQKLWLRIYRRPQPDSIPAEMVQTFPEMNRVIVQAICYEPFQELGGKSLAETIRFGAKEQLMIEEAARRLAAGNDPGIIPERFLIGAARAALDRRLARPGTISENFYRELSRR
jgi:hypothetical protein